MENNKITDKDEFIASKLAYIDWDELDLNNEIENYTIQELFINNPELDNMMGGYSDENDSKATQELINEIKTGKVDIANWKIVDSVNKNNVNGFCAITLETPQKDAVVAFRGSEKDDNNNKIFWDDWIWNDTAMGFVPMTSQQAESIKYVEDVANSYNSIYTTGHSLGGNLAEFAVLGCNDETNDKIVRAKSFDGPGINPNAEALFYDNIKERSPKLNKYIYSEVGNLINGIGDETIRYAKKESGYNLINGLGKWLGGAHTTNALKFNEDGSMQSSRWNPSLGYKQVGNLSRVTNITPDKQISNMYIKARTNADIASEIGDATGKGIKKYGKALGGGIKELGNKGKKFFNSIGLTQVGKAFQKGGKMLGNGISTTTKVLGNAASATAKLGHNFISNTFKGIQEKASKRIMGLFGVGKKEPEKLVTNINNPQSQDNNNLTPTPSRGKIPLNTSTVKPQAEQASPNTQKTKSQAEQTSTNTSNSTQQQDKKGKPQKNTDKMESYLPQIETKKKENTKPIDKANAHIKGGNKQMRA